MSCNTKYSYSLAILVFYFSHAAFSLLLASVEAVTQQLYNLTIKIVFFVWLRTCFHIRYSVHLVHTIIFCQHINCTHTIINVTSFFEMAHVLVMGGSPFLGLCPGPWSPYSCPSQDPSRKSSQPEGPACSSEIREH